MRYTDLHTHTVFSDGKNTPEEMVLAAIDKNMACIGISDHSYTEMDASYALPPEKIPEYQRTIRQLKDKYRDRIEVLCGIELDACSDISTQGFDYVIGSVHHVDVEGDSVPVDWRADLIEKGVEQYFGGDIYALIEAYYRKAATFARKKGIDIIGHIDVLTKFNEPTPLFDTEHPRYKKAWMDAVDQLLTLNVPFEINTGAIARGYRTTPYPAFPIARYIRSRGGRLILSSDAHSTNGLCCEFDKWQAVYDNI